VKSEIKINWQCTKSRPLLYDYYNSIKDKHMYLNQVVDQEYGNWSSLYFNLVPIASCRLFQNLEVKRESLSDTIDPSTP
jgi:hypothetical protein